MEILLLDPDLPFPEAFVRLAARRGWRARHHTTPRAAIAAAVERPPDVVVIEDDLPGCTGRYWRDLVKPGAPAILTGLTPPEALGDRIALFLPRPFALCQLFDALDRLAVARRDRSVA